MSYVDFHVNYQLVEGSHFQQVITIIFGLQLKFSYAPDQKPVMKNSEAAYVWIFI